MYEQSGFLKRAAKRGKAQSHPGRLSQALCKARFFHYFGRRHRQCCRNYQGCCLLAFREQGGTLSGYSRRNSRPLGGKRAAAPLQRERAGGEAGAEVFLLLPLIPRASHAFLFPQPTSLRTSTTIL